jgi:opacity protein-like surface antigen
MTLIRTAGLAAASLTLAAALALPAAAADLGNAGGRGSIKDYSPAPMARSAAGPCYYRIDTGYSFSSDPTLHWNAVNNNVIDSRVTSTHLDGGWLAEAGFGCGSGSRGLRGDVTFGYHGERDIYGTTGVFATGGTPAAISSKILSSIQTYTGMVNAYYDLGNLGGFVPYVGAGVGLAYHRMSDYTLPNWTFSNPPNYAVRGDNDLSLAWSLMAGAGWQVSDRAIVDFGYRYIDFGRASTARNDNNGNAQVTRLHADSLDAHEIKIGLRYHFGAPAGVGYAMK